MMPNMTRLPCYMSQFQKLYDTPTVLLSILPYPRNSLCRCLGNTLSNHVTKLALHSIAQSYNVTYHTLHALCVAFRTKFMSIGSSGRIVIEVEPNLKRELYAVLSMDGKTLKDWFVTQAESFVESRQLPLQFDNKTSTKQK